jgi:hypothetical protein
VALSAGCRQDGLYFISGGSEAAVLRFLEPLRLGEPVAAGYRLENVQIDHNQIRLELKKNEEPSVFVEVFRPWNQTTEFATRPDSRVPRELSQAIERTLLGSPRPDSPWVRRTLALSDVGSILILSVLLALIGTTGFLLIRLVRRSAPPAWAGVALVALTLLAAVLRLTISPRTFLHEFYHVPETITLLFDDPDGAHYGLTGPAIYRAADFLLGGREQAVFLANAVLATLTITAVVLFDLALFANWTRALLAGAFACLLPVHLRFSASEELWIPGILFACWSLAAWACWVKSRSTAALVAATLSLALAMQARPELLLLPVAHLALFFAWTPRSEWRSLLQRGVVVAVIGLAILLAPHLTHMANARNVAAGTTVPAWSALQERTILLDRSVTPSALKWMAVLGAWWGLRQNPRTMWWLLALAAMYLLVPMAAYVNRPCIYRTEMFSLALTTMVAAGAPSLVAEMIGNTRWLLPAATVSVGLMAFGLWARRTFVTELLDQQQEIAFVQEAVAGLPQDVEIVVPAHPVEDYMDRFPGFLLERTQDTFRLTEVDAAQGCDHWPAPHPGLYVYEGMFCHFSVRGPPPEPRAAACEDIFRHYTMRPANVRLLQTRGYSEVSYAKPPFEIGFFEVTGVRGDVPASGSTGNSTMTKTTAGSP